MGKQKFHCCQQGLCIGMRINFLLIFFIIKIVEMKDNRIFYLFLHGYNVLVLLNQLYRDKKVTYACAMIIKTITTCTILLFLQKLGLSIYLVLFLTLFLLSKHYSLLLIMSIDDN